MPTVKEYILERVSKLSPKQKTILLEFINIEDGVNEWKKYKGFESIDQKVVNEEISWRKKRLKKIRSRTPNLIKNFEKSLNHKEIRELIRHYLVGELFY